MGSVAPQVGEVKAQLVTLKGFGLDGMKLIYSGAVLSDTQTLESLNVKEGEFLVCVVRKAVRA